MSVKATSLRISEELAAEIAAVARAEEVPIFEAIRAALHQYMLFNPLLVVSRPYRDRQCEVYINIFY